jgi:hypothetical protein
MKHQHWRASPGINGLEGSPNGVLQFGKLGNSVREVTNGLGPQLISDAAYILYLPTIKTTYKVSNH